MCVVFSSILRTLHYSITLSCVCRHPCFRFALQHNLQNVLDSLLTEEADAQSIMEATFKKTHDGILNIAAQTNPPDESGTTATVALVLPYRVIIAHVGDSRAVLCCREGKAWVVTKGNVIIRSESDLRARLLEYNSGRVWCFFFFFLVAKTPEVLWATPNPILSSPPLLQITHQSFAMRSMPFTRREGSLQKRGVFQE